MGPGDLKWILDAAGAWFDRLKGRRDAITDREEEAIQAFLAAMQETRFFLRGEARDKPHLLAMQQRKLSDLWLDAARLIRHVDRELAMRCDAKARYWSDPGGWKPKERADGDILIQSMENAGRRLLSRGARS